MAKVSVNDLSLISIHNDQDPTNYIFLDPIKYPSVFRLFHVSSNNVLVFKWPYLRRSYQTKRRVSEIIIDTLPATTVLAVTSIVLASFFGILVGIISAVYKNSWFDKTSLVLSVLGMSGPSFFIGLILAWIFLKLIIPKKFYQTKNFYRQPK